MDKLAETVALRDLKELKESEVVIRDWLFKGFIGACIVVVLIIIWKNPILQFVLATIMFLMIVLTAWLVFQMSKTGSVATNVRRIQGSADIAAVKAHKNSDVSQQKKISEVINAIRESDKHHGAKTERDLEHGVSSLLKEKFPHYNIMRRSRISGKPGVFVDNDVELQFKVAEKKRHFEEAAKKIKSSAAKPAVVILDTGKIEDIDRYVEDLRQKGAKVVVLKRKKDNTA